MYLLTLYRKLPAMVTKSEGPSKIYKAVIVGWPLWAALISFWGSVYVSSRLTDLRLNRLEADVSSLMVEKKEEVKEMKEAIHRVEIGVAELRQMIKDKQ